MKLKTQLNTTIYPTSSVLKQRHVHIAKLKILIQARVELEICVMVDNLAVLPQFVLRLAAVLAVRLLAAVRRLPLVAVRQVQAAVRQARPLLAAVTFRR